MPYNPTTWVNDQTPLSAGNMNKIEQGIKAAHDAIDGLDTRTTVLTYTDGRLSTVEEKDGEVVVKTTNLNYDASGRVSSVTVAVGGVVRTKIFHYDSSGNLTSVTSA